MVRIHPSIAQYSHGIVAHMAVHRHWRGVAMGCTHSVRSGPPRRVQSPRLPCCDGRSIATHPSSGMGSDLFRQFVRFCRPTRCTRSMSSRVATSATSSSLGNPDGSDAADRKRVVFLGTPDVAAVVLNDLIAASRASQESPESTPWEIAAVVTQPGRPKGRGKVPQPSPVYSTAVAQGIPESRIFCPMKASEEDFLSSLASLSPDVCVTAAYGNYLPTSFLKIPAHGTLNIHPSLLPLYRGAAPVQRSLQDGVKTTGVTVLYTVKEMDAGPIVCQTAYEVGDDVTSPELLDALFRLGTERLIECLPLVWDGRIGEISREQDHARATHAGKIGRDEGRLRFEHADVEHNKTRAFYGWPGTYGTFVMVSEGGKEELVEIKVLETRVRRGGAVLPEWEAAEGAEGVDEQRRVVLDKAANAMVVRCADGSVLELLRLQSPGKKPVDAKSFGNGLGARRLYWRSS